MKRLLTLISLILISSLSYSQIDKKVLKSNSKTLSIKENGILKKDEWTIVPEKRPDIYLTNYKNQNITFYSDVDSIIFLVEQNNKIQFNVILNSKDTALTEIIYQRLFLEILKTASIYDTCRINKKIKFKYQSKNNSHLKSLRKYFKLDSIAGDGDEVSQLINLMNWLHNKVEHNGTNGNPKIKNAQSMLTVCSKEKRGLNCRGLAIAYNECCLSMGFKSRIIVCLPKDSLKTDNDCHVINSVFVNKLNKWIWIDPTFNSFVMDENNNLLGIQEVRDRLINNKYLKISSNANWNNKNKAQINEYLYNYMAKNLYYLQCPIKSKYNMETRKIWKVLANSLNYVTLIPKECNKYFTNFIFKETTNPEVFWSNPL